MNKPSLTQLALNSQWEQLPGPLQAHYQSSDNIDVGALTIEYPRFMQPILNLLRLMGVLINRRGKAILTTVEKYMQQDITYLKRRLEFPDGRTVLFRSH